MLNGYRAKDVIYENETTCIQRYESERDGHQIIVKTCPTNHLTTKMSSRLRYEHKVLSLLRDSGARHVIRPIALHESMAHVTLALEDIGGSSLSQLIATQQLTVEEILGIAINIVTALQDCHAAHVIHKDVNLANIIYNPQTKQTQLIDFGIAAQLSQEFQFIDTLQNIEGTLNYISPEQTGKINRLLDYRTDYYSLGVTLYTLFGGRLPFTFHDSAQLIHAILAKEPEPLIQINPILPLPVAAITHRLMEKIPEKRYQSATGILHDLQRCFNEIKQTGLIANFELGQCDQSETLTIPQHLYGREQDLIILRQAYQEASNGTQTLVLLTGASGMGKSALVYELQQDLLEKNGFFLQGKYDQLRRHVPFSAFQQAMTHFVRKILMENEGTIQYWRQAIQHTMGNIGQLLIDIVPSLELLVGKQKPVSELGLQENENRLFTLLQRFIRVITKKQPVVLFLDDIQWADPGTLRFLTLLSQDHQVSSSLLIILAYRKHELSTGHLVLNTIQEIEKCTTSIASIEVLPLTLHHIENLLADMMNQPIHATTDLAQHILKKTAGNPFFVHTFIKRLWDRQLLQYDGALKRWYFDIERIGQVPVADNVVDLLTEDFHKLTQQEIEMIGFAACLGAQFSLQEMSRIKQMPSPSVASQLDTALRLGLIMALEANYRYASDMALETTYRFTHDKVQQAAYENLTQEQTNQIHYTIGQAMYQTHQNQMMGEWVFGVVDHLNRASTLLLHDEEKLRLVQLNTAAGDEAQKAASYTVALTYFELAHQALPPQSWDTQYDMTRRISLSIASNQFMLGEMDAASNCLLNILQHARTSQERAEVQHRRMLAMTALARYEQAIQAGKEALNLLGYSLSSKPSVLMIAKSMVDIRILLLGRNRRDLAQLPSCTDENILQIYDVMVDMVLPAYLHNMNLFVDLCLRLCALTIRHGLSKHSACCFILNAVLSERLSNIKDVNDFVYISDSCRQRFPNSVLPGAVSFFRAAYAEVYQTSGHDICAKFEQSMLVAIEDGDPLYASWSATLQLCYLALRSIPTGIHAIEQHLNFVKVRNTSAHTLLIAELQWAKALAGLTFHPKTFDDANFSTQAMEMAFEQDRMGAAAGWYYSMRCMALWLQRDMEQAAQAAVQAGRFELMELVPENRITTLFMGLALLQAIAYRPNRRHAERKELKKILKRLQAVTSHDSNTYTGFYTLLQAEQAGLQGQTLLAIKLYEQALTSIARCGYPSCLAAALECAGRFHHQQGNQHIAKSYLVRSFEVYKEWGSTTKVNALQSDFPSYLLATPTKPTHLPHHATTSLQLNTRTQSKDSIAVSALLRASQALATEVSMDKLLHLLTSSLIECAGATRAVLITMETNGELVVAIDSEQQSHDLPYDIFHYVMRTQEDWILDTTNEQMVSSETLNRVHSILCSPVLLHGSFKGMIYLENRLVAGIFTREKELGVRLLASQAFISLENARLLSHLEETVHARTEQLQEAHRKLVELERETTQMQMAGGFAHEMRNALSIARMPLSVLQSTNENGWATSNEQALNALTQIISMHLNDSAQATASTLLQEIRDNQMLAQEMIGQIGVGLTRGLSMTKEILQYAEVGQIVSGNERVHLANLLEKLLQDLREVLNARSIETNIIVPSSVVLPMKEEHAYAILRNLLANAADALAKQPIEQRKIMVHCGAHEKGTIITVQDTGIGMAPKVQAKVFQPFFSTKGVEGTGLGLGLSRRLAHIYHGQLNFTSKEGIGTTFTLQLPSLLPGDEP